MGYPNTRHVVAIVRLVGRHRVLLLCPYMYLDGYLPTVPTVDDRVGGNTYTLPVCTYLIGRR